MTMRKGDRVVVRATGERGEIRESDWVLGDSGDLWSEKHFAVARDGIDNEAVGLLAVGESGVQLEHEYDEELHKAETELRKLKKKHAPA